MAFVCSGQLEAPADFLPRLVTDRGLVERDFETTTDWIALETGTEPSESWLVEGSAQAMVVAGYGRATALGRAIPNSTKRRKM